MSPKGSSLVSSESFPHLRRYGLDDRWVRAIEAAGVPGSVPGRVAKIERGGCEVVTETGTARAELPALGGGPCTGDWVALTGAAPPGGTAPSRAEPLTVAAVLPRRTALQRSSSSRRSDSQVLAANVDVVAVVAAADAALRLPRLERLLALAWDSGAQPLVVLTKADALEPAEAGALAAEVDSAAPGVDVFLVSARSGAGTSELAAALAGTVVLIGPSGVGKSTLGNVLVGSDVLRVGDVRAADGKGRHTTVHRELVPTASGGVLIDTPGLRGVGLPPTSDDGLQQVFAEVTALAAGCRFNDCGHTTEPGCAVLAAVEAGTLPARRLDSYRKLVREAEWAASRADARLRAEREQRRKAIHAAQRQLYQREPGRLRGR